MTTIAIWLLIAVSDGMYNRGNVTVVERFATPEDCAHVLKNITGSGGNKDLKCVQAKVVR